MKLEVLLHLGIGIADPAVDEIGRGGDPARARRPGRRSAGSISLNIPSPLPVRAESPARRQDSGFRGRRARPARRDRAGRGGGALRPGSRAAARGCIHIRAPLNSGRISGPSQIACAVAASTAMAEEARDGGEMADGIGEEEVEVEPTSRFRRAGARRSARARSSRRPSREPPCAPRKAGRGRARGPGSGCAAARGGSGSASAASAANSRRRGCSRHNAGASRNRNRAREPAGTSRQAISPVKLVALTIARWPGRKVRDSQAVRRRAALGLGFRPGRRRHRTELVGEAAQQQRLAQRQHVRRARRAAARSGSSRHCRYGRYTGRRGARPRDGGGERGPVAAADLRSRAEDALVEEARLPIILLAHAQEGHLVGGRVELEGEPFGGLAEIAARSRFELPRGKGNGRRLMRAGGRPFDTTFGLRPVRPFRLPRRSRLRSARPASVGLGRLRPARAGSRPARRPRSRSSVKPATSFSNISAITSTPCACSSASSGERATLTWMVTDTSGWSAIFTSWTPIALIGRSSTIWFLATLWPGRFQRLGEVAGGNRAVELAGVRRLADQLDLRPVDLLGVLLGVAAALGILRLDLLAIGLEHLAVRCRWRAAPCRAASRKLRA